LHTPRRTPHSGRLHRLRLFLGIAATNETRKSRPHHTHRLGRSLSITLHPFLRPSERLPSPHTHDNGLFKQTFLHSPPQAKSQRKHSQSSEQERNVRPRTPGHCPCSPRRATGRDEISAGVGMRKPPTVKLDILIILFGQFISSQRPSLADTRLTRPDVQHASTNRRSNSQGSSIQGHERYDYDGRNDYEIRGPNSKWPFNFSLKGGRIPSRVYHTHKVVPRSRPNAKKQLGKRKWHPSRRHGRVIRREDYDAYQARELGQPTQFLNSESLLDLSVRGGRAGQGKTGRDSGGSRLWRWPRGGESKLGKVTRRILCICRG